MQIPICVSSGTKERRLSKAPFLYADVDSNSVSWEDSVRLKLEFRLRFPAFQPIDPPWVNNSGREPNAGDEKPTWSARRCHFVRHAGNRPSRGQRRKRSRSNNAVAAFVRNPRLRNNASAFLPMPHRPRYLIVDGHSIIFAWPELRKLHRRRSSLAREELIKRLRQYQDWTGVRVVIVFDGKGPKVTATSEPADVQIFYSRSGQSADAIIERLASKYAKQFDLMVATSDSMEAETVHASGAQRISPDSLRELLERARE